MNTGTSSCGQPYETPGGLPNSCAYTLGNFSTVTQSAINTCCGSPPHTYNPANDPPGCFQSCNIQNASTADELEQSQNTLLSCLSGTGVVNLFCSTTPPKASSGNHVHRGLAGWSMLGAVGVLAGTSLFVL
jgi:hypothetical protein